MTRGLFIKSVRVISTRNVAPHLILGPLKHILLHLGHDTAAQNKPAQSVAGMSEGICGNHHGTQRTKPKMSRFKIQ